MLEKTAFCEKCGRYTRYNIHVVEDERVIKGKKYLFDGEIAFCSECGYEVQVADVEDKNTKRLLDSYRQKNGGISLVEILEIPQKYRIGKRPLSLLLNWGETTFSRYCEGAVPSKQYSDILRRVHDEPEYYLLLLERNKGNLKSITAYEKSRRAVMALLAASDSNVRGYDIRENSADYAVGAAIKDLDVIIAEGENRYDGIVREDLPLEERFNEAAYQKYIRKAKISDALAREAILKNLKCAGLLNGKLCFTNAGALFFRINDEDVEFRHAGIVCALYKGTGKAYVLDAKELNGDLVSNVDDAIIFLKKHLRISFKIEGLQRENILELPEEALREAVVNAACHRDYFEKGARVMVEIFDDRVDIVSPGGVCKGITDENFGAISITRNSNIASMFYRIGFIEQMGTGIEKMKRAAKEANVAEPEFNLHNFFKVTFRRNQDGENHTSGGNGGNSGGSGGNGGNG
ncbi:MAG: hypothetical protein FWG53_02165, partial [Clostridiales bacterium]|nr:hypothetical protein [Clostridiales bacterium]